MRSPSRTPEQIIREGGYYGDDGNFVVVRRKIVPSPFPGVTWHNSLCRWRVKNGHIFVGEYTCLGKAIFAKVLAQEQVAIRCSRVNGHTKNRLSGSRVCKSGSMWRASINVGSHCFSLGVFKTQSAALAARKAAEKKYWGTE